ncbi:RNA recognition motif domain-containing protein [Methanospirillum stamsii]|uniref:RRM domain-containing protein n=1 Tax=Methanospirillum stamsii TaxID=1277351 RepID=A0A2V2N2N8_9EURY|nr:hypothetical protein [Methanospirillum stamsii]PWR70778.1 hypothetical protein DLD82_14880 [Methanospirillum stamsii]
MNPKRLFVGNLTYTVDEKQLWGLFSRHGEVVGVRIIEGKGYGFVEMESYEDARAARNALNETEFQGRNLLIDDVRPPKSKSSYQNGSGSAWQSGRGTARSGTSVRKTGDKIRKSSPGSSRGSDVKMRSEYPERSFKSAPRPYGKESDDRKKPGNKSGQFSHGSASKTSKNSGKKDYSTRSSHEDRHHSRSNSTHSDKKITGFKPVKDEAPSPKRPKVRFWPGGRR